MGPHIPLSSSVNCHDLARPLTTHYLDQYLQIMMPLFFLNLVALTENSKNVLKNSGEPAVFVKNLRRRFLQWLPVLSP